MKILLAGGGTAGHINPALAIAQYVREQQPDAEILFVGNGGGMESILIPKAGFDFAPIDVRGFRRKINAQNIKHNIGTVRRMFTSTIESEKIIKNFKPDVAVGTGGYVSGPVIRKCAKMGVPCVIHEQNAFPGMTTKALSKKVKCVMLAVPQAKEYLDESCNIEFTGNPLRGEIIKAQKAQSRAELGLDDRPLVLSFGGSLGADRINDAVAELLKHSAQNGKLIHIHGTGRAGYDKYIKQLNEMGLDPNKYDNINIRDYIDDMPRCLAAADVVISRAGAISISELQAQGKASILIPSPNVAENHQYHNAMALVKQNAAEIIEEKDLTGAKLIEMVEKMTADKNVLDKIGANAKKMAIIDARERIYKIILKAMNNK